jgi:hypothetical protein
VSGEQRLERLKELVGRLEQLPGSEERDRVLGEVRARAVDLDTGVTPRAMLEVTFVSPHLDRPARRPSRSGALRVPAPVAATVAVIQSIAAMPAVDDRLSLEDSPLPDADWKRGLRG